MKRAAHEGRDPRNMTPKLGKVYERLWRDDCRRRPWTVSDGFNIWDIEGEGDATE